MPFKRLPDSSPEAIGRYLDKDMDTRWGQFMESDLILRIQGRKQMCDTVDDAIESVHDNIEILEHLITLKLAKVFRIKERTQTGIDLSSPREIVRLANLFRELAEHVAERDEYLYIHLDTCKKPVCELHNTDVGRKAVRAPQRCGQLAYSSVWHTLDCKECQDKRVQVIDLELEEIGQELDPQVKEALDSLIDMFEGGMMRRKGDKDN